MTNPKEGTVAAAPFSGDDILIFGAGVRLHEDKVRQRMVLLAPERTLALDEIGVVILKELDGEKSVSTIVDTLTQRFQAPRDQVARDVAGFLLQLVNSRFIDVKPSNAS